MSVSRRNLAWLPFLAASALGGEPAGEVYPETHECCDALGCLTIKGEQACRFRTQDFDDTEFPDNDDVDSSTMVQEEKLPVSAFKELSDRETLRGRFATALLNQNVSLVIAGEVVGESAFLGPDARRGGVVTVQTVCTIRVLETLKGDAHDEVVAVFEGGSLRDGLEVWPSHTPKCLPFDVGVFSFGLHDGVLVPAPIGTVSLLKPRGSGEWYEDTRWNTLLDVVDEVRRAGGLR